MHEHTDDDLTPVEVPNPLNGVRPRARDALVVAAAAADESAVERLIAAINRQPSGDDGGGGGGDDNPGKMDRATRKQTWIVTLVVALFGSGGIGAAYLATQQRSVSNEKAIQQHLGVEYPATIQKLKNVETVVETVAKTQADVVVPGIEALKKESQTKEKRELERALELERERVERLKQRLRGRGERP